MLITPRVNQCENMWKRWQTCFYKNLAPFVTEDWQTSSLCTAGAWCRSSANANGTRHQSGSSVFPPVKCDCCRCCVQGGQLLQNQVHAAVSLQGAGQTVILLLLQTLRAQLQELLLSVIQLSMYRYYSAFRSNDFHRFSAYDKFK